jgi:hypothetical protein
VVTFERTGVKGATRLWFAHAPADLSLREMKIIAHEYDSVMTLLVLPRGGQRPAVVARTRPSHPLTRTTAPEAR